MANLTRIPAIDNFETQLSSAYSGWVGTINVTSVPSWTIESGETSYLVINPWKSNMQVVEIDGWNSWANTFNVVSITVEKWNGVNYTSQSHAANSIVRFSNNYAFWKDIRTALNSKVSPDVDNTFSGTQTFNKIVATWYTKDAVYADNAARDTAIPSPSNGMRVYNTAVWLFQKYQAWGWIDDTWGATTPNADTTTAGKVTVPLAQASDLNANWSYNVVVPSQLTAATNIETLVDKDTYILWEDVTTDDITNNRRSLFAESWPTFVESTSVQNIWEATGNTRVAIPAFWSWTSMTTLKLALKKFTSPSANLSIRIETDSSWASWTLVNANATASVTSASLTTSLADTTATFAWAFTIPLWQKVWIVLNQAWDVVNGTNYYGVWYVGRDTTTRGGRLYNWSVYGSLQTSVFYYTSSAWLLDKVLSKTDSDFSYQLPTDGIIRLASSTASAWSSMVCYTKGIATWFTSLVINSYYFIWSTPWSLSLTPWTNSYCVWMAITTTDMNIWDAITYEPTLFTNLNTSSTPTLSSPYTSASYYNLFKRIVTMNFVASASVGISWHTTTTTLQFSSDNSTRYTAYTITCAPTTWWWTSEINRTVTLALNNNMYYRINSTATSTTTNVGSSSLYNTVMI